MPETKSSLLNVVNSSGFLFQLALEHEIRSTLKERNARWDIISREHRWVDPESGNEGFIDLILESGVARIIIECKRVRESRWIFLVPNDGQLWPQAKLLWSQGEQDKQTISGWDDFNVRPGSYESAFCIVRGQSDKTTPMLERISGILLRSTEALADQELGFDHGGSSKRVRIYLPVIATTAKIEVCHYDPTDLDVLTGDLSDATFEQVPIVRFRKALSSSISHRVKPPDLSKLNIQQERTIFVVEGSQLTEILRELDLMKPGVMSSGEWPWTRARRFENSRLSVIGNLSMA